MSQLCFIKKLKKIDKMKKLIILLSIISLTFNINGQSNEAIQKNNSMKLNAGILTEKLEATKKFYTEVLDFGVSFENEFYLLLHTPNHEAELSFLLPNHPTQNPFFHTPFGGKGMYLTIEVDDVDKIYAEIKSKGVAIEVEIRDEPWGDRK